jgi:hypothetical protein
MTNRPCKCGCGEDAGAKWEYKRGHKPKGDTPPRTQLAKLEPVAEIEAAPEEEFIEISFNAASLDRLFNMLSLYEKSVAIAAALGSE